MISLIIDEASWGWGLNELFRWNIYNACEVERQYKIPWCWMLWRLAACSEFIPDCGVWGAPLPGMIWILIIFPIKTQYPQPAALLSAFYTSLTHIARNQGESLSWDKYLTKSFETITGKCHHFLPNNLQSNTLKQQKIIWFIWFPIFNGYKTQTLPYILNFLSSELRRACYSNSLSTFQHAIGHASL